MLKIIVQLGPDSRYGLRSCVYGFSWAAFVSSGAAFTVFRELHLCLFEAVFRTSVTAFMHTRAAFVVQSWRSSGNGFRSAVSLLKTCAHKWSAIMEWWICHDESLGMSHWRIKLRSLQELLPKKHPNKFYLSAKNCYTIKKHTRNSSKHCRLEKCISVGNEDKMLSIFVWNISAAKVEF